MQRFRQLSRFLQLRVILSAAVIQNEIGHSCKQPQRRRHPLSSWSRQSTLPRRRCGSPSPLDHAARMIAILVPHYQNIPIAAMMWCQLRGPTTSHPALVSCREDLGLAAHVHSTAPLPCGGVSFWMVMFLTVREWAATTVRSRSNAPLISNEKHLSKRGRSVRDAGCRHRCPHIGEKLFPNGDGGGRTAQGVAQQGLLPPKTAKR